MYQRRFFHLLVASLIAMLVGTPAFAQPPTTETIDVDLTFVNEELSAACGFDIVHHVEGQLKVFEYANAHNRVDLKIGIHVHGSFTNAATGESVPYVHASTDTYTLHADGSETYVRAGLSGMLTVQGQGQMTADVGRIVLIFPADGGEPTVAFEAGIHDFGPLPALCDVLTA